MQMKITQAQADRLMRARTAPRYSQKEERKAVYAQIRKDHGISNSTKLKVAIEDPLNPLYLVIRSKHTGLPLDNGIAAMPVANVPVAVGASPVNDPVADVATAVKKVAAKKAAAKPAKSAAKPAKVSAPAKKAPAAKAAKPVADDGNWPRDYRATIGGKRVRLGEATSAAHAKKLVAKYKKQHNIE